MPEYNDNADLLDMIKALQDRIETLEKANPLNNGTVDEGGITIKSGGSLVLEDGGAIYIKYPDEEDATGVYIGDIYNLLNNTYLGTGVLVQDRDGGDRALMMGDVASGASAIVLRDHAGTTVFQTDASNKGLARPNVHYWMRNQSEVGFTTSETSYVSAYEGYANFWSPRLVCWFLSNGAAGRGRLMVDNIQVGSEVTWSGLEFMQIDADLPSTVSIGSTKKVELQIRSEAGSATAVFLQMLRGGAT